MKTLFSLLLAGIIVTTTTSANPTNNSTTSTPKVRPAIGMTKEKARSYYGAPFTQMVLPNGERWYYRLKFNEVYGRAMVPFHFDSPNVCWGSIDFGQDGRVKSCDWRPAVLH